MGNDLAAVAKGLDFVGRKDRQRKVRLIRWDSNERLPADRILLEGLGYTTDVKRMLVGDYGWDLRPEAWFFKILGFRNLIIERKSLSDLRDVDRLMNEVRRMRALVETLCILLIDHRFDTDSKRRWKESGVLDAELSLQFTGMKTTHCGEGTLANRLDEIYRWSQKAHHTLTGGD